MYAVIETGGKQYKVSEGDVIYVEKLDVEAGADIAFDKVLLIGEGSDVKVGAPVVDGVSVAGKVIKTIRLKRSLFTSTNLKKVITRNRVTDSHILKLKLQRLMVNF